MLSQQHIRSDRSVETVTNGTSNHSTECANSTSNHNTESANDFLPSDGG